MSDAGLAAFRHRSSGERAGGRDRWTVDLLNQWVSGVLPDVLAAGAPAGPVLDVGCGEQPYRPLVERSGRRYVSLDVVQNAAESVDILSAIADVPADAPRFSAVLCTEVLSHVPNVDAAFAALRRLCVEGALVVITNPFIFPLNMEPYDYRRLTLHGCEDLGARHGFRVERADRLGDVADVLATVMADASILPATRTPYARLKARVLRAAAAALVRAFDSRLLRGGVALNSHVYLTNGVILRAR